MVIAYREKNGRVEKRLLRDGLRIRPRGEPRPDKHFSETLLKAYYARECEQGSRFRSIYTKDRIKRTHDTAIARFEHTGAEH